MIIYYSLGCKLHIKSKKWKFSVSFFVGTVTIVLWRIIRANFCGFGCHFWWLVIIKNFDETVEKLKNLNSSIFWPNSGSHTVEWGKDKQDFVFNCT